MGRSSSQLHATSSLPPLKQIARGSAHLAVSFVVTRARCRCTNGTRVSASVLSHCSCSVAGLKNGRARIWSSPITGIFVRLACDIHATTALRNTCVAAASRRSPELMTISRFSDRSSTNSSPSTASVAVCMRVTALGSVITAMQRSTGYDPAPMPAFHLSTQVARRILRSLRPGVSRTCVLLSSGRQDESTSRSWVMESRPVPATTLSAVPASAFTSVLLPAPVSPNSITRRCSVFPITTASYYLLNKPAVPKSAIPCPINLIIKPSDL